MNDGRTLFEALEFQVVAGKKNDWSTFAAAQTRLNGLVQTAEKFERVLAGMEGKVSVKFNTKELEQLLKQNPLTKATGKNFAPADVAKVFGIPDERSFTQAIAKARAQQALAEKELTTAQKKLNVIQRQFDGTTGKKAKSVIEQNLVAAQKEADRLKDKLDGLKGIRYFNDAGNFTNGPRAAAFGKKFFTLAEQPSKATGGATTATVSGNAIPLVVPPNRIEAILGPGNVKLLIPGDRVEGRGKATDQESGVGGKKGKGKVNPGAAVTGNLLSETITEYSGSKKPKTIARKFITDLDETIEVYSNDLKGEFKRVTRRSKTGKNLADLQEKLAGIQAEVAATFGSAAAVRRNPKAAAAFFRSQADTLDTFQNPALEKLGYGRFNTRTASLAATLRGKADDAAAYHADQEQRRAEQNKKSHDAFVATGENERQKREQARQTAAQWEIDRTGRLREMEQRRQMSQSHAALALQDFKARGGQFVSDDTRIGVGKNGRYEKGTKIFELESGGNKERMTVRFDEAGASVQHLTRRMSEAREEAGLLGGDFLKNTLKVAAWSASVGVLYKTMQLATSSFAQMVEVSGQTARLQQIFSGVGGSAQALTSDVLHLAAVTGRSGQEAMDSAISWARLGLNRVQINEAVRLSLMAANVAELTAAESTEHLQAIMKNYGLTLGELAGKLGSMNQISNIYNVTNADMLQGVSRTAAVAKQAGLSFEELLGILGATIGATKQTGANIGNAIKSITLSLSNPSLQKKLRLQFGFEATSGGDIKSLSTLLGELFVKYQKMANLQRQSLLFAVGGKTQASRLASILDNYVQSQVLAINAQLHLNSAEQENLNITTALKAQLQGVVTEWERFAIVQGNNGGAKALGEIATALRNVLGLLNAPGMNLLVTGLMGVGVAGAARLAMTGLRSGGQGFLGRSGARIAGAASNAMRMTDDVARDYVLNHANTGRYGALQTDVATRRVQFNQGAGAPMVFTTAQMGLMSKTIWNANALGNAFLKVGRSSEISSRSVKLFFGALGGGLKVGASALALLGEIAVPLLVITVALEGFNAGMEAIGLSSESANKKLAGFNANVEQAHSAAEAYAQAARLMTTAQQALTGNGVRPEDAARTIAGVATAAFANEPEDKQEKLTAEFQQQLTLLVAQKDVHGVTEILATRRLALEDARRKSLVQQREAMSAGVVSLNNEIARLKSSQEGLFGFIGRRSRVQQIAEKEAQKSELQGDRVKNILAEEEQINNSLQERLSADDRHLAQLEQQKVALEGIAAIYDQINTSNPLEKTVVTLAKLQAQSTVTSKSLEILNEREANDTPGQSARDQRVAELKAQRKVLLQMQQDVTERLDDTVSPGRLSLREMANLKGDETAASDPRVARRILKVLGQGAVTKIAQLVPGVRPELDSQQQAYADTLAQGLDVRQQLKQNALDTDKAAAGELPDMPGQADHLAIEAQRKQYEEEQRKRAKEMATIEANLKLARDQSLFAMGQQQANRGMTRNGFGVDATDTLNRQRGGLNADINRLQARQNAADGFAAARNFFGDTGGPLPIEKQLNLTIAERGQLLEDIFLKTKNLQDLINRQPEIEREINQLLVERSKEFTKSFFGDGPAEMLKKLAAFRLAFDDKGNKKRDVSQGQFFSMDPSMRGNYGMLNPSFDPHMLELKNEFKRNVATVMKEFGSLDPKVINQKMLSFANDLTTAMKGMKEMFPTTAVDAAAEIIEQAGTRVGNALDSVAKKLEEFSPRTIDTVFSGAVNGTVTPFLPAGRGGAKGF